MGKTNRKKNQKIWWHTLHVLSSYTMGLFSSFSLTGKIIPSCKYFSLEGAVSCFLSPFSFFLKSNEFAASSAKPRNVFPRLGRVSLLTYCCERQRGNKSHLPCTRQKVTYPNNREVDNKQKKITLTLCGPL